MLLPLAILAQLVMGNRPTCDIDAHGNFCQGEQRTPLLSYCVDAGHDTLLYLDSLMPQKARDVEAAHRPGASAAARDHLACTMLASGRWFDSSHLDSIGGYAEVGIGEQTHIAIQQAVLAEPHNVNALSLLIAENLPQAGDPDLGELYFQIRCQDSCGAIRTTIALDDLADGSQSWRKFYVSVAGTTIVERSAAVVLQ